MELVELSEKENNTYLKKNLSDMALCNKKIASGRPSTLREAIQWMCWFSFFSRLYNRGPSGGQLDEILLPYYENDIKNGIIDDEEAKFYLACLFLNDTRYYQLAGPDERGEDITNHLSYLILEAADWIDIPCNLTVRVHDKLDKAFFRKSVSYLLKIKTAGHGFPATRVLLKAL